MYIVRTAAQNNSRWKGLSTINLERGAADDREALFLRQNQIISPCGDTKFHADIGNVEHTVSLVSSSCMPMVSGRQIYWLRWRAANYDFERFISDKWWRHRFDSTYVSTYDRPFFCHSMLLITQMMKIGPWKHAMPTLGSPLLRQSAPTSSYANWQFSEQRQIGLAFVWIPCVCARPLSCQRPVEMTNFLIKK